MYYVIADVEWVEKGYKKSPTQLSALRVDENWNVLDRFSSFIRPMDASFYDWSHIAYSGGKKEDFIYAYGCHKVFEDFNNWVGDDTVCWWCKPSLDLYLLINKIVLKNPCPKQCVFISDYLPAFLGVPYKAARSAYRLAKARNIPVPEPEHYSANDVSTDVKLLKEISFPQSLLSEPPQKPDKRKTNFNSYPYQYDRTNGIFHRSGCELIDENADLQGFNTMKKAICDKYRPCACVRNELKLARCEKVIDEINRSQYTFVYTENSDVFHRYTCGLLHNASHILGAVKYETVVAKGLRPCKVCNPAPDDQYRECVILEQLNAKRKHVIESHSLSPYQKTAMKRLKQSQKERFSALDTSKMSKQEKDDFFILTQPRFGFFAALGYQTFHTRNCPKLNGKSNIRGFETYDAARRSGFTPCKQCKPNAKQDILVSIPIGNKERPNDTVENLSVLCDEYGYSHRIVKNNFELETPVGKWIILINTYPVTVKHINLAHNPECTYYHTQHRIFLSMIDALHYIHRHDLSLMQNQTLS